MKKTASLIPLWEGLYLPAQDFVCQYPESQNKLIKPLGRILALMKDITSIGSSDCNMVWYLKYTKSNGSTMCSFTYNTITVEEKQFANEPGDYYGNGSVDYKHKPIWRTVNYKLPPINSKEIDYWRFYNKEIITFISSVRGYYEKHNVFRKSSTTAECFIQGANRSSNVSYAQAGILTKITKPLGGVFEFERNGFMCNRGLSDGGEIRSFEMKKDDQVRPRRQALAEFKYYKWLWLVNFRYLC